MSSSTAVTQCSAFDVKDVTFAANLTTLRNSQKTSWMSYKGAGNFTLQVGVGPVPVLRRSETAVLRRCSGDWSRCCVALQWE